MVSSFVRNGGSECRYPVPICGVVEVVLPDVSVSHFALRSYPSLFS